MIRKKKNEQQQKVTWLASLGEKNEETKDLDTGKIR